MTRESLTFLGGFLPLLSYQLVLAFALQALGLVRDASLFPLELLVFALLTTCLYLYSTVSAAAKSGIIAR